MNTEYRERELLLKDIERYFECELSDEEERDLRLRLSETKWDCNEIDEARAVIGFSTIKNKRALLFESFHNEKRFKQQERRKSIRIGISAAAIFLSIITIASVILFAGIDGSHGDCIAYFNGHRVTDEEKVMEIMQQQFAELESGVSVVNQEAILEMSELGAFLDDSTN